MTLLIEHYEQEIPQVEREIKRRKDKAAGCDCQAPNVESGAALVSEECPIHAPKFIVASTVF